MANNCPPIFPEITNQEKQIIYISTIVACENAKSNSPLIEYLAVGMTEYLNKRLNEF